MNDIRKISVEQLGYGFIPAGFLPEGENEYYLRFRQQPASAGFRALSAGETESLKQAGNRCDNWNNLLVSDPFVPSLIRNCSFSGLIRLSRQEPYILEFRNLRRPVGLYNSNVISCDIGQNVVIENVEYLSHYIVGNDVMIVNSSEIETTDRAKFGNGILKDGETESVRIKLELCNENGGRSIIPFDGMLPGDAWLWTRHRDDQTFQDKLVAFTDDLFDKRRGYYGTIGDRTVIKNCKIIKDVRIGTDAYLKGANKLKNLTIHSSATEKTQIGEGCELVNGIVGYGCRIFYGVKAVRFILASHSQLKYGARLINSYLGNNATISCCEVLNSLIFPAHEQHHNNSFLCAALLMGQSNMAAGATVGSNHNSRGADGELVAGRGFWPGLCVSLKHHSRFASFIILAKADYPAELDIPFPFSLVSNDVANNELIILPAYWFLHNMYALARNAWKYADRDKRVEKIQLLEFDYLAPDSVNEIIGAIRLLERFTGEAFWRSDKNLPGADPVLVEEWERTGKRLLDSNDPVVPTLEIFGRGIENSRRKVRILKVPKAYTIFRRLIRYHAAMCILRFEGEKVFADWLHCAAALPVSARMETWTNVGGQLIPDSAVGKLVADIRCGKVVGWAGVHSFYQDQGATYAQDKLAHALHAFAESERFSLVTATPAQVKSLLLETIQTQQMLTEGIRASREKDYSNPFRRMLYSGEAEMEAVLGAVGNNDFIRAQEKELEKMTGLVTGLIARWNL